MDTTLINDLKGENNRSFGQLYQEYFSMISRFVTNNSGQTEDAEDLFQDTMVVLIEKLRQDNFELTASLKTYIMAIAKNLWLKRLRSPQKTVEFSELLEQQYFEEINLAIEAEKTYWDKLQNYLHQITEHCKGLIHDMFFQQKRIEQIQKEYGYSSKQNAQNQKYKCVEQIRKVKELDKNN
jgi:RNA polymerase sigma factor (sigma-70 family)